MRGPGFGGSAPPATAGSQICVNVAACRGSAHCGPGCQPRGCLAGQLASRPAGELGDHRVSHAVAGIPGVARAARVLHLPDGGLAGVLAVRSGGQLLLITAGTVRRRRTILADRIILADRQIEILRGALGGIRRGAVRGGRLTGTVLTRTIAVDGEVRGAALLNAVSVGLVVRVRFGFDGVGPLRRPGGPLRAAVLEGRAAVLEGRAAVRQGRAGVLEGRAAVLEGRAAVLEGRAAVLEGRAAVLLTGPVEVRRPALGRNARTGLVHRLLRWCGAVLQERGEFLGICRVHAEYHPRAPPRLLDRVTDIAGDRRQRFCRQAVRGTPAVPSPLKHCCGALRTGYEPWIRLWATPPGEAAHPPASGGPLACVRRCHPCARGKSGPSKSVPAARAGCPPCPARAGTRAAQRAARPAARTVVPGGEWPSLAAAPHLLAAPASTGSPAPVGGMPTSMADPGFRQK